MEHKRQPTIHIKVGDLENILRDLGIKTPKIVAQNILAKSQPFQLRYRSMPKALKNARQTFEKSIEHSDEDISIFNGLLYAQSLMIHSFKQIRRNSTEFRQLQEVVVEANNFAKRNEYSSKEEAYKVFIFLAQDILGQKFHISKLKYHSQNIQERLDIMVLLEMNDNDNKVKELLEEYKKQAKDYTTFVKPMNTIKDKGYLLWAIKDCETVGANYNDWIEAQFEGLAFLDDIPLLTQLSGENAIDRYYTYKQRKGYKGKKDNTEQKENFTKYASEAERKYFEKIRTYRNED